MIHSFSKIKTDRNYNEDFKTYTTIGLMQYLPASMFWSLIRECIIDNDDIPTLAGEILQVDFWVKWYKIEGTNAERYVEPDVFFRFENFDCIIEVKKSEDSGQHHDQWDDQLKAYKNTYPDGRRLIYIALGGNKDFNSSSSFKYSGVYKASWHRLLHAVHKSLKERMVMSFMTASAFQEIRILQSVIDAFGKYNEYDVEFLESITSIQDIELSTNDLLNIWK